MIDARNPPCDERLENYPLNHKTTVSDTVCPKRPSEGWFAVSSRRFRLLNPCGHAIVGRITEFSVAEAKNKFLSLIQSKFDKGGNNETKNVCFRNDSVLFRRER